MYRNAQRLLNLVNQLLDFRKNEMAGLHLTLSEGDIVAYVRSICASFLMLSEKKHVHLTFFSAMESLNMSFDGRGTCGCGIGNVERDVRKIADKGIGYRCWH